MKMKMKTFVCRVSQRETSTNRKDGAKDRPVFHDQLYEIFYYFFVMSTAAAIWTAAGKPFPFFLFFLFQTLLFHLVMAAFIDAQSTHFNSVHIEAHFTG